MSIVLVGTTSGSVTLQEPAIAGTTTINLPATSGTAVIGSSAVSAAGQIPFSTDGSTYTPTAKIVAGTAVASTSGTSIDFTSIPSWVKRVTVMLNGVSTNGTSMVQIQLGAGSVETSGYFAYGEGMTSAAMTATAYTSGFGLRNSQTAAEAVYGQLSFTLLGSNTWLMQGNGAVTGGANAFTCGGGKALSGTLDRVRITTVNGTDTFDAGSINILWE
jgi:hypothetical protein